MTFDPMSVEVTCVTLPKDHCVQVPWKYINVCGYSDQFCKLPHTYIHIHTYYVHTTNRISDLLQSLTELSSGETKMCMKHAKFCHFYAKIVKFGQILTHFNSFWGQTGGGGRENSWGKMPHVPLWCRHWVCCSYSTRISTTQCSICRVPSQLVQFAVVTVVLLVPSHQLVHIKGWRHYRPIPGKVKLLLISVKKSGSLLDHISRFLSHQFVTWYLRSISKTKIVKLFLSVHEWAHDLYQKCHKHDPNVKCHKRDQTKYCIKRNPDDRISYEVYEIVYKYVVRHLCIAQYKIP